MKASSLAWVRLNSVPVIRAARPSVVRQFIAAQVAHAGKLRSLDDLEPSVITDLNARMSKLSGNQLEHDFLEFVKGKTT